MGKRHFNEEWLSKPDSNSQAISLWCIKKITLQPHANYVILTLT